MRAIGLLALCAGCSSILGIEDVTEETAPANTVIGTVATRCHQTSGTVVTQPRDLTTADIRALVPDAAEPSGYRDVSGTGLADGTFRIDDVPDGASYIFVLDDAYYVTLAHVLDLHDDSPRRCDPPPVITQLATDFTYDVMGTAPALVQSSRFGSSDAYLVSSTAVGYTSERTVIDGQSGAVETFDWREENDFTSEAPPLLDQSAGDDLTISHVRRAMKPFGERRYESRTIVETFMAAGVTMTDGMPATVAGTLAPATADQSFAVTLDRGLYDTAFANSEASNVGISFDVTAGPVPSNDGAGVPLLSVALRDWTHGSSYGFSGTETYADPFPAAWSRYLNIEYYTLRLFEVSDGNGYGTPAGYRATLPLDGTESFEPRVASPTNVMLGGTSFTLGGGVLVDGRPIMMTWSAVPGAKVYELTVSRFSLSGSSVTVTKVATLQTGETQLAIPTEVFGLAAFYTLRLAATVSESDYEGGELVSNGAPIARAELSSGLFRIGTTCGNGTVEPDEACDGESPTCDRDCSAVRCGDGMVNTLAGETCDTVADTYTCDEDCTPNECGDGYVNFSDEDCEPPGAPGCSSTCVYTSICGNSVVEVSEACDGDLVMGVPCNPDCTMPTCGDGFVQATETCDDGNTVDGDTCSATCN
jgi:cysteine-rich repeat protein